MDLKIPPAAVALVFAISMWAAAGHLPWGRFHFPGRHVLAALLLLAGMIAPLLGAWRFRKASTTVDPMHPDRTASLVTKGIYGRTRNPMYLGFLLLLLAWGLRLGSLPALLLITGFVLYMNRFQILPEERALERKFGDRFRAYKSRVRRWI